MTKQRHEALVQATLAWASFALELHELNINGKSASVRSANAARYNAKYALLAVGYTDDEAETALKATEAHYGFGNPANNFREENLS